MLLPSTAVISHPGSTPNSSFTRATVHGGCAFSVNPGDPVKSTVEFDTVAREWRCKWSEDSNKASLIAAQKALDSILASVKAIDGVKKVDRIVCGGCLDFKVITSLTAEKFGDWEKAAFAPESDFLAQLKKIDGISDVETQTYTFMTM